MATPQWPAEDQRTHIGGRIARLDGPVKSTGAAKYTFDINRPDMLYAKVLGSAHALAKVNSIDLSRAKQAKGVKAVWADESLIGKEVRYAGQIIPHH